VDECSDEEKLHVEERMFASNDTFDRLCEIEEDLIARYVRGEMTGEERAHFERAYSRPPKRDRVLFNAALGRLASDTDIATSTPRPGRVWRNWLPPGLTPDLTRSGLPVAVRWALAAATLILAIGAVVELRRAAQLQSRLEVTQQQVVDLRQRADAAARDASESQRRIAALVEQVQGDQTQRANVPPRPLVVAVVLSPGLTRGTREPARVQLPPAAETLRLQLDLDADGYRSFRVELRNDAGDLIWSEDEVTPRATASGRAVTFAVPAALMRKGAQQVTLRGLIAGGRFEDAAQYDFEVVGR
jgi:hypothetical protein